MPTSDRVFLTGATGFVGGHVLDALQAAGYRVRALARQRSERLRGSDVVVGDLRAPGELRGALEGCRYLIHCAALYTFSPRDREALHHVNVAGTAGLLEAARLAGVERAVVTSSSATLGPQRNGRPADERDWAEGGASSAYHHSKLEQERAAFMSGVPAIALLPTAPVGPGDAKPTPTGKLIRDFADGRIFAMPPRGGLNVVPVEDVARAHVGALEHGKPGERYVLGGENLTLDELWRILAELTGRPLPSWRAPYALALGIAHLDELRCRLVPDAVPFAPLEGVRMSRERMFVDASKARRELNFAPGSARDALARAVAWYRGATV